MTISDLSTFVATYVAAAKQAGTWSATTGNIYGLLDKIGKQVIIDGVFQDKLPEFNGDDLPLGKTIEEWFIDLVLPVVYDSTGANALAPSYPSVESAAYSYTLGRRVIPTSVPYDNVERAALDSGAAGELIAKIMQRLTDSYSLFTYQQKKQLLANLITKSLAATNVATLVQTLAIPSDTSTAEAFIKQVKNDVETASFANEGHSLNNCLIGAAPELVLLVKKGVMSSVEVDALAGAFNAEKLALPARVIVVDDFGSDNSTAYAMLVDPRGIKLHRGYHAIREQANSCGDFINYFDHSENTGFISKNTFVKIYKAS